MLDQLSKQISEISWVQWVSFLTGLLYVYYAAKDDVRCWIWGILSSALWSYSSWFELKLKSDTLLQLVYVILGFVGWYYWTKKKQIKTVTVSRIKPMELFWFAATGLVITLFLGTYMKSHGAAYPFLDAGLFAFSVEATLLLVQEKLENWIAWMIINSISIPIFFLRGGYLFSILFIIYLILAIKGWIGWNRILSTNANKKVIS